MTRKFEYSIDVLLLHYIFAYQFIHSLDNEYGKPDMICPPKIVPEIELVMI